MSNKKKSKDKSTKLLSGRRGIIIVALLAAMILIINVITLSYSWFEPQVKKGTGMNYTADLAVRSDNCSITGNYLGTRGVNGKLIYSTTISNTQTIEAESIMYFRTVIANNASTPTNVSLYISTLPAPVSGNAYGLGVAYPSSSYHKFSSQPDPDFYIIRNAYIAEKKNDEAGQLKVDWFIKTGESAVTIDFTKLYLMYN